MGAGTTTLTFTETVTGCASITLDVTIIGATPVTDPADSELCIGETTTVTNMGIIYTSSPIFIILISAIFFNEKINFIKIIGLVSCLIGVFAIIIKGDLNLLLNLNYQLNQLLFYIYQLDRL